MISNELVHIKTVVESLLENKDNEETLIVIEKSFEEEYLNIRHSFKILGMSYFIYINSSATF